MDPGLGECEQLPWVVDSDPPTAVEPLPPSLCVSLSLSLSLALSLCVPSCRL